MWNRVGGKIALPVPPLLALRVCHDRRITADHQREEAKAVRVISYDKEVQWAGQLHALAAVISSPLANR